jgi:hypothetical protein
MHIVKVPINLVSSQKFGLRKKCVFSRILLKKINTEICVYFTVITPLKFIEQETFLMKISRTIAINRTSPRNFYLFRKVKVEGRLA